MIMGQAIAVPVLGKRVPLDQQGIVHRKKYFQEIDEVGRFQALLVPIEPLPQGQALDPKQIGLGGFIDVEKPDIFLVNVRDAVFQENQKKSVLGPILQGRNSGPGLQFPFFDKGVRNVFFEKFFVGIDKGVVQQELVELIS
jgi:hypothetical protein